LVEGEWDVEAVKWWGVRRKRGREELA